MFTLTFSGAGLATPAVMLDAGLQPDVRDRERTATCSTSRSPATAPRSRSCPVVAELLLASGERGVNLVELSLRGVAVGLRRVRAHVEDVAVAGLQIRRSLLTPCAGENALSSCADRLPTASGTRSRRRASAASTLVSTGGGFDGCWTCSTVRRDRRLGLLLLDHRLLRRRVDDRRRGLDLGLDLGLDDRWRLRLLDGDRRRRRLLLGASTTADGGAGLSLPAGDHRDADHDRERAPRLAIAAFSPTRASRRLDIDGRTVERLRRLRVQARRRRLRAHRDGRFIDGA